MGEVERCNRVDMSSNFCTNTCFIINGSIFLWHFPFQFTLAKGIWEPTKKFFKSWFTISTMYEYYSNTNVKNDANNNHKIISDSKRNRTLLQSLKLKISRLFRARSPWTIECRFTLKRVRDLIITYSQQSNNLIWAIEKEL